MGDPIGRVLAMYQPDTVLDVGAGHGGSLTWLLESFPASTLLVAMDIATPDQPPPKQVQFVRADAVALPLPDRSLPAVTARATLHHVTDPPAAVQELARVVADGGVLVVRDATALSSKRAADLRAYLACRGQPPEPHAGVDPDQIAQAVVQAGLTIASLDRAAGTAMLAGPRFATPAFQLVATRAP